MSAPIVLQAIRNTRVLSTTTAAFTQQLRCKGTGRYKVATDSGKQKDKWIPRVDRMKTATKQKPANWDEKFMSRRPTDDVWFRVHYPAPRYPLADVLDMHREYAAVDISDNASGLVEAELSLDMAAKKKNKYLMSVSETILLPHYFDDGTHNSILAFCKEDEDKAIAENMGAAFSGGSELVKAIEKGEIHHDDYTHVVCTLDMLVEVSKVRKHMIKLFPNKRNGNLDDDMDMMMRRYSLGKNVISVKDSETHSKMIVTLGNLNMSNEVLQENFNCYLDHLEQLKGGAKRFVNEAIVRCKPSNEKLHIVHNDLQSAAMRNK